MAYSGKGRLLMCVAGVVLLVGLAGAFYGTAINRALRRPDDDQRIYRSAPEAVSMWARALVPDT